MSLYTAVRSMLTTGSALPVAVDAVCLGVRTQTVALPAIVYNTTEIETLSIGNTSGDQLKRATVSLKIYHNTAVDVTTVGAATILKLIPGTYDSLVIQAIVVLSNSIQEPSSDNGEETNPFVGEIIADYYYKET